MRFTVVLEKDENGIRVKHFSFKITIRGDYLGTKWKKPRKV